ncbi:unnamed protein product [Closterium sp. NIES-53]
MHARTRTTIRMQTVGLHQHTFDDEEAQVCQEEYQQKVGSLQFAATTTRPDIAFACSNLGSSLTVRSNQHWREVDRCLAYLANTHDTALDFDGGAEYAGDKQHRTSTNDYVFVFEGAAISWSSQRIKCMTLSSTELEYVVATEAGKEGRRLCFLLAEFRELDAVTPSVLWVDNKSAITVVKGMGLTSNLKHMERRQAWLQHMVKRGKFSLRYIPTAEQPADFLTKALHYPAFNRCTVAIGQCSRLGWGPKHERGRGVSTGVVVGPVFAWAEPTSGSGVRGAADLQQWASCKQCELEESGATAKEQHKGEENLKAAKEEEYGEGMWGTIASAAFSDPTSATGECDWLTLHRRMGHVALPILQQLVKNEMVAGIRVKGEPDEVLGCPTCMQAKFIRFPFSSSEATAKAPLDEVVMDVVGPLKLGAAGAEYFLIIVDVYTRMTWVYVLSKKSDVAEKVKTDWLPMVEQQQDRLVKSIRTD